MLDLFIGTAWAQSGGAAPAGGGASMLIMFGMVFAIMYFLMIRPQNKRMQAHAAMVAALKKGDELVTVGGLHGRIHAVEETSVSLEIAKGIRVSVDKDKVARIAGASSTPDGESK
jgi:preprotein translocase subunit YajC